MKYKSIELQKQLSVLVQQLINEPPEIRKAVFKHHRFGLLLFAIYYFTEYCSYPFDDYHIEYCYDLQRLLDTDHHDPLTVLLIIGFRESAKSSLAFIAMVYAIAYQLQPYINLDSADTTNSSQFLFDAKVTFFKNKQFVYDFGHLVHRKRADDDGTPSRSQMQDFITTTNLRVESHSINEPIRGRRFGNQRPSLLIGDDVENFNIATSDVMIQKVRSHFDEAQFGLSPKGRILILGNKITDFGNISYWENKYSTTPKCKVTNIPLYTENNENDTILWRHKYTFTPDQEPHKVDINIIKAKSTTLAFSAEMMNSPIDSENALFKVEYIKQITQEAFNELTETTVNITNINITIDTAYALKTSSDYTAIITNYIDASNHEHWYIKSSAKRLTPNKFLQHLDNTIQSVSQEFPIAVITVGVEDTQFSKGLEEQLKAVTNEHHVSLVFIKHKGIKKEDRIIKALLHKYENGKITHITPHTESLERQLLRFPLGNKHDDEIDGLSMGADEEMQKRITPSRYQKATIISNNPTRKGTINEQLAVISQRARQF